MTKKEPISFEAAMDELKQILQSIEQDTVNIDDLAGQVARAKQLKEYCEARLTAIENSIEVEMTIQK